MKFRFFALSLFFLGPGFWSVPSYAQQPTSGHAVRFGESPPIHSIKQFPPEPDADSGAVAKIPVLPLPGRQKEKTGPGRYDPVAQISAPQPNIPTPTSNFAGLSNDDNQAAYGFRVLPPDTNGDVGPNHYVQTVNLLFRVFDKTGAPLTAPLRISHLFIGLGGPCDPNVGGVNSDGGDPIVLYDHLADRWLITQFTDIGPPFHQCIAISQSGDPTGAYFLYDFVMPGNKFNDYPKFGVWPDAYYMSDNQFNAAGTAFLGAGVFAFDRARMLIGDPKASFIYFDLQPVDPFIAGLLPADLDGPPPPSGTPNYFAYFTAGEFGDPQGDALRVFEFHADFVNPANSTFIERSESPAAVAAFDPVLSCGSSGSDCIPQPAPAGANARLDGLSDRLMYRLQYRNFAGSCPIDAGLASCGTLVVNHTVDADGTSHAGIRWYILKINESTNTLSVHDQGTYAPDAHHRWMGSAAMDGQGNLAVGYSVSSSTLFPSIRYAGRLASDAPGTLGQGESTLQAGAGSQTDLSSRWGDYSMLSVDPVDDCTFWYTTEYYSASSTVGWRTRIGSFKFPTCGGAVTGTDLSITKSDSPDPVIAGNNLTYTLAGTNNGPDPATGVVITDTLPAGVTFVSSSASQGSCSGTTTVVCSLGSLASGATATVTIVVRPNAAGTITNTASIAGNEADPNTANNSASAGTMVNAGVADLVVTSLSNPPAMANAGTSFSVTDTTANTGTGSAGASTTRYRLSLDANITSSDPLLTGTRSVPGLAAGASSTGTVTVTIPTTIASGTYFLGACADDTGVVAESNNANNCRASATTVTVSP